MSDMELVLNMLVENTITELSKVYNSQGLKENREIARRGGKVAGETRKSIETETGKFVGMNKNTAELNDVINHMIEMVAEDKTEK